MMCPTGVSVRRAVTILSRKRQDAIDLEQAEQAFVLLRKLWSFILTIQLSILEMGQIYLNRLDDLENAAKWFLRAWEKPGAPFFAARIYAELFAPSGKERKRHMDS